MTMDEAVGGLGRPRSEADAGVGPPVETLGFDAALAELQAVVGRLEAGGQPLEEALALYERGVALQERLERLLADAELRIRRLVERGGGRVEALEGPGPEEGGNA
jgi:exodeoxyribonuclease VII small subunit